MHLWYKESNRERKETGRERKKESEREREREREDEERNKGAKVKNVSEDELLRDSKEGKKEIRFKIDI